MYKKNLLKNLNNFLLLIISTYFGLLLIDLFIENFITYDNSILSFKTRNYIKDLKKEANNQVIKLRKKGYLPVINPKRALMDKNNISIESWFPLAGKANSYTYLSCNEGYGLINYKSDRLGFRNKDKNWDKIFQKESTLFIGDSFIHGYCVDSDNTIPKIYSNISGKLTFNLGMGNNTPYYYIAIMKYLIEPLIKDGAKINEIYLIFYTNDNTNTDTYTKKKLSQGTEIVKIINKKYKSRVEIDPIYNQKQIYAIENVIGNKKPTAIPSFLEPYRLNLISLKATLKLSHIKTYFSKIGNKENFLKILPDYSYESPTHNAIKYLKKLCNTNCIPKIAVIPNSKYWDPDSESKNYINFIKKISKDLKINFIDLSEVLDSNSMSDYAPGGVHLSKKGYQKTATFLIEQNF